MKLKLLQEGVTKAYEVHLGNIILYFSYNTLIAYRYGHESYRLDRHYSNTTSRHINTFGLQETARIDERNFHALLLNALKKELLK